MSIDAKYLTALLELVDAGTSYICIPTEISCVYLSYCDRSLTDPQLLYRYLYGKYVLHGVINDYYMHGQGDTDSCSARWSIKCRGITDISKD